MESNPIFEKAVSFVNHTNQPVFLTGKAGTGKTTFLRYIREHSHKRMAVLAPTGVAAINAGGSTIHSFFFLPFGTYIPTTKTVWGGGQTNVYNKHQLFEKAKLSQVKRDIIKNLDTLIIDEISMVRADILDAIDALLRMVRRKPDTPFGGIQMIFIGDMFQLPPVVKDEDWEHLKEVYNSPYFFDALVMKDAEPVYIELKKIYRQNDEQFIKILNRIRNNEVEAEDLEILNDHYDPYFIPDAHTGFITLTTHNYKADEINQSALEQIMAEPVIFEAKISGEFPPQAYPVEDKLVLKEGAQIMFIKNDKGEERRYYNGKIGTIAALDGPNKKITVRFLNEDKDLVLEPEEWKNLRYDYNKEADEIKEIELGTYTQYPIRLAWAVTIHKSQGLTFEKAIIDAGQSFAPGQVYVALSRLTSLSGLVLKSRIAAGSIHTDPRILAFAEKESDPEAMDNMLLLSQQIFAEQSVATAFDFTEVYDQWLEFTKDLVRRAIPEKDLASAFALAQLEQLRSLDSTAQKFEPTLKLIINEHSRERYTKLSERVQAGAVWFLNILNPVLAAIQEHIKTFKLKAKSKKYIQDVQHLWQITEKKRIQIEQAAAVALGLAGNVGIQSVIQEVNKMFSAVPAPEGQTETASGEKLPQQASKDISLELFLEGKSPEKIAEIRGLGTETIYTHLSFAVSSGKLEAKQLIDPAKMGIILREIAANPEAGLTALKEKLGAQYSYTEIKIARAQFEFEQAKA